MAVRQARGTKITAAQRDQLFEMLAARWPHKDIAAQVGLTVSGVEYYTRQNKEHIAQLRRDRDAALINQGLRNRQYRIDQLEDLAYRTKKLLIDNEMLAEEIRVSGKMEVRFKVYAESAVRQYRGLLDDIAKEMGDRKNITEYSGVAGEPIPIKTVIGFSPDEWDRLKKGENTDGQ